MPKPDEYTFPVSNLIKMYETGLTWLVGDPIINAEGINLGEGRVMSAEDVVEGHFMRLMASEQAQLPAYDARGYEPDTPQLFHEENMVFRTSSDQSRFTPLNRSEPVPAPVVDIAEAGHSQSVMAIHSAIKTLAPTLTPLIEVAEQVARVTSPTPASTNFRQQLQAALAAESQQRHNKQVIGILCETDDLYEYDNYFGHRITLLAGVPVVVSFLLGIWFLRTRNPYVNPKPTAGN